MKNKIKSKQQHLYRCKVYIISFFFFTIYNRKTFIIWWYFWKRAFFCR